MDSLIGFTILLHLDLRHSMYTQTIDSDEY